MKIGFTKKVVAKSKKGFKRLVFSRIGIITLLLIAQFLLFLFLLYRFELSLPHFLGGNVLITVITAVYIVNSSMDPSVKITWLVLMLALPFFTAGLLLYTKSDLGHRALKKAVEASGKKTEGLIKSSPDVTRALFERNKGISSLARYVAKRGAFPVYNKTNVTYLSSGEEKFIALKKALRGAEKFIFLEYFIIAEGSMWDEILSILKERASHGVEVKIMYDGTCEFTLLPHSFPKKMRALGIECRVFAPITPFVSTHYNYRDHRKIAVIDGQIAFTGGVNIADEYINRKVKFGHWKDVAVRLEGDAVNSFTLMFLQLWGLERPIKDFGKYLIASPSSNPSGFVIPFSDCPVDKHKTGERVYMDILNRATDYVHIMTPYLIIDNEMETALKFAAERGVEVSLILPGIPDKKGAFALAKTHYRSLISSGVKIYEYSPGFIHAKVFVSDDREAVVGTINLDYRSLYHHFECAAYMANTRCIEQIENDFQATLAKCRRVTKKTIKEEKLIIKIRGIILKFVAPLM